MIESFSLRRFLSQSLPAVLALCIAGNALAADVLTLKGMTMELARDIAQGAIEACREKGYQVSAVVVDRSAVPLVSMRDALASGFTTEIARRKANAVALSGISSGQFAANRPDLAPVLNHLEGILVLRGGLPVRAAGSLLGAVGVSGAPGGDIDESCAQKGLDKVAERLEFSE